MNEFGGIQRATFSGLASGLDTRLLIDAAIAAARRPLNLLEARRDDLEKQQSLFRDFNTKLLSLRDAARDIDNLGTTLSGPSFDEEFLSFGTETSDDAVFTAVATGDANPGNYDIRVNSLALASREITESFASSTDVVAAEGETLSIDFGVGDERNFTITVGAGGASLINLRDAINLNATNDDDINAEVLFDGTEYRLVIAGTTEGAANDFDLSGTGATLGAPTFVDAALSQAGTDASLTVLGVAVTSSTNTIEGALPGVTLTLTGTSDPLVPTDTESLTVSLDNEGIKEKLQSLVDAYNGAADFINNQFKVDESTNRSGPLSNDSLIRSMQRTLQNLVTSQYSFAGNSLGSLNGMGVELGSDGRLSIDAEKLEEVLVSNPQSVRELLSGDGTNDGAAAAIARALEGIVRSGDGTLAERNKSLDRMIDNVGDQITRFENRLLVREETLLQRFGRLESTISSLQAQQQFFGF